MHLSYMYFTLVWKYSTSTLLSCIVSPILSCVVLSSIPPFYLPLLHKNTHKNTPPNLKPQVPELTPEEKLKRKAHLKTLIETRKKQRAEEEKQDALTKERNRRKGGKQDSAFREDWAKVQQRAEKAARIKEKKRLKEEREKINLRLAKDKAERARDKAEREGRDPKQAYEEALQKALDKDKTKGKTPDQLMDVSIASLKTYRVGDDGLKAIKTLKKMVNNIYTNPSEAKFQSINLDNVAFKKKVGGLKGGLVFLKAVGFAKEEISQTLVMHEVNLDLLKLGVEKLSKALE